MNRLARLQSLVVSKSPVSAVNLTISEKTAAMETAASEQTECNLLHWIFGVEWVIGPPYNLSELMVQWFKQGFQHPVVSGRHGVRANCIKLQTLRGIK